MVGSSIADLSDVSNPRQAGFRPGGVRCLAQSPPTQSISRLCYWPLAPRYCSSQGEATRV